MSSGPVPPGTIQCLFCNGFITFPNGKEKNLFFNHIKNDHNIHFNHNYVMAVNVLDDKEKIEKKFDADVAQGKFVPAEENSQPQTT